MFLKNCDKLKLLLYFKPSCYLKDNLIENKLESSFTVWETQGLSGSLGAISKGPFSARLRLEWVEASGCISKAEMMLRASINTYKLGLATH